MEDKTYNGWKNRQTWNVSLWINNDEPLYRAAVGFMEQAKDLQRGLKAPYAAFIKAEGLNGCKTPDGYKWDSKALDYKALNEMMLELVD